MWCLWCFIVMSLDNLFSVVIFSLFLLTEFDAKCSDTEFVVYFNKTSLDSRNTPTNNRTFTIKFAGTSESACRVVGTSSINTTYDSIESTVFTSNISIGTKFSENMCGINVLSDDTHIIFNTTIIVTYGENPKDFIRREEYDYYSVMCLMNRTVDGKLSGDKVDVTMRKDGKAARSKYILLHFKAKIFSS